MKNRMGAFLADRLPFRNVEDHIKKPLPKAYQLALLFGGHGSLSADSSSCYRGVFSVLLFALTESRL